MISYEVLRCAFATWLQKAYVAGGCGLKDGGCEGSEGKSVR